MVTTLLPLSRSSTRDLKTMTYEAGYTGGRALRTWQERMALLKKLGFIRCQKIANQNHRYVLMVEPSEVIKTLAKKGLVDQDWHATYDVRRFVTKEAEPAKKKAAKVLPPSSSHWTTNT